MGPSEARESLVSSTNPRRLFGSLRYAFEGWLLQIQAHPHVSRTNLVLGALFVAITIFALLIQYAPSFMLQLFSSEPSVTTIHVAFIGNSMIYYNDFPRFLSSLSGGTLTQQSCLHGDSTLSSILVSGNGMYNIWDTGNARVYNDISSIHDFGACTVEQMLFGYDYNLEQRVLQNNNHGGEQQQEQGDDFMAFDDGKNPCLQDEYYYEWLQEHLAEEWGTRNNTDDDQQNMLPAPPKYDFIVLNDNTRSPARLSTRQASLNILNTTYVSWFLQTGATPVFVATYGYSTPYRDMGGLGTVPEFTSLTHYGYKLYAKLLEPQLPSRQKPRIAPVGIAFLVVWQENYNLWERLFHVDQVHASPLGTYLQGCVVYHTLYRRLPDPSVAIRGDMSSLWWDARRFQPGTHRTDSFPTQAEAQYLYHVAFRVMQGYVPSSFIKYKNGEAAYHEPQDDLYRVDDLF